MTGKNKWIIALVMLGIFGVIVVEGVVNPRIEAKQSQYEAEQQDPLTHDFAALAKYRSPYMGDFSNLSHLNQALPLNGQLNGYQLVPETFTAQINYRINTSEMKSEELERILVYNAAANFVWIENLEHVLYSFEDVQYTLSREAAQQWAGTELKTLHEPKEWDAAVRKKLVEPAKVKEAFSQIVDN
ncbi:MULTISPECIES: DUF4825 domain-containing protein [unclassified Paenibacillus]|uniref:DUF4825 domain-containing protein n=1 Tax=unclassified Paenibacillus TaxID=185978 RepID=UPI00089AC00F|nr:MULTISPECIES: DUF4825 domain-containing protein [unclassified Paenibacillus]SEB03267.1 protein of unknown function [Paenibacillus sp. 276b]SLK01928.1 protein of unknown function [Paenibacillus sp. RU5A]SOC68859.1 protein of unknown function [Paenibacillus sp. RU26A]SOC71306.1 protein of unknown function [Paenibacillus sp. RU5M]